MCITIKVFLATAIVNDIFSSFICSKSDTAISALYDSNYTIYFDIIICRTKKPIGEWLKSIVYFFIEKAPLNRILHEW